MQERINTGVFCKSFYVFTYVTCTPLITVIYIKKKTLRAYVTLPAAPDHQQARKCAQGRRENIGAVASPCEVAKGASGEGMQPCWPCCCMEDVTAKAKSKQNYTCYVRGVSTTGSTCSVAVPVPGRSTCKKSC